MKFQIGVIYENLTACPIVRPLHKQMNSDLEILFPPDHCTGNVIFSVNLVLMENDILEEYDHSLEDTKKTGVWRFCSCAYITDLEVQELEKVHLHKEIILRVKDQFVRQLNYAGFLGVADVAKVRNKILELWT